MSEIEFFAYEQTPQILSITMSSFDKESNLLNRPSEALGGSRPIHLLQETRPVVIMDEPQRMEGEAARGALGALLPMLVLRYSATHRRMHNRVYRLSPQAAYDQGLVKHTMIDSITVEGESDRPWMSLKKLQVRSGKARAQITLEVSDGHKRDRWFSPGDALNKDGARHTYEPYQIDEIDPERGEVSFTTGDVLSQKLPWQADARQVHKLMLRLAIKRLFSQQKRLKQSGVKPLALFAVDSVSSYIGDEAYLPELFDELYREMVGSGAAAGGGAPAAAAAAADRAGALPDSQIDRAYWASLDPESVRASYFAQKGSKVYEKASSVEARKVFAEQSELILRNKERILSFDEPVHFIFTHTALIDAWDNPNVFVISAMREIGSETQRRQLLGRGLRLPVDQDGRQLSRSDFDESLAMIVPESYGSYIEGLQKEGERDGLVEVEKEIKKRVGDRAESERPKLRRGFDKTADFQAIASSLDRAVRVRAAFNPDRLVSRCKEELKAKKDIGVTSLKHERRDLVASSDERWGEGALRATSSEELEVAPSYQDVVTELSEELDNLSGESHLPRELLWEILRVRPISELSTHPQSVIRAAAAIIKRELLVESARSEYELTGDTTEGRLASALKRAAQLNVNRAKIHKTSKGPWSQFEADSKAERDQADRLSSLEGVRSMIKLPDQWKIPTIRGEHTPDYAVLSDDDAITIIECKSVREFNELRPEEREKTLAAAEYAKAIGAEYELWGYDKRRELARLEIPAETS